MTLARAEAHALATKEVTRVERKVLRKARRLVEEGAVNATRINDNGLDDQGSEVILDEERKRIALDMRKSKRHAPVYIDVLLRRVESAEKAQALQGAGRGPLNVGVFVHVAPPQYPAIEIAAKEDDER